MTPGILEKKKGKQIMAVTMAEITKLRHMTSAGLMDCKKALAETNGDIEAAVEILRKKGQAVAAKREDREAAEGCVLAKNEGNFAALVALKCETDFVAKNAGFVDLTKKILDAALANRVKSIDELKALTVDGQTIEALIVEESGKTGEKTELGAYEWVEAPATTSYNHLGNKLSTIAGFNLENVDYQVGRDVAMQIASMNPVAIDQASVPAAVVEAEYNVAVDKTKQEQVKKAVEAALKKAGINPNLVDSEAHIESNIAKGWLTADEADKARKISAETAEAKAANLPEQMIKNIADGRLRKFYKENCLMEQEFVKDGNLTIAQYLEAAQKGLVVVAFKRVNLNED
jgi:elongation factor Ts